MTMKGFATSISVWILLVAVPTGWAQSKHSNSGRADSVHIRPFGKVFNFPLGVQCHREVIGQERTELNGFDLEVKIAFLGPEKMSLADAKAQMVRKGSYSNATWFRAHTKNQIKYLKYNESQAKYDTLQHDAWQKERERIQIAGRPLEKFGPKDQLGNFTIRSEVKMQVNDVIRLGNFDFQPENPGFYRIDLRLSSESALADSEKLCVYFECPDYRPVLSMAGPDTIYLRDIGYEYTHTPIVNTVFFENSEQPRFMDNPTDRIFRSLLFGRAVVGLSCPASKIDLHAFPDPLFIKNDPRTTLEATLERSRQRAEYVEQRLRRLSTDFINGIRCGAQTPSNTLWGSKTKIEPSQCGLSFNILKEDKNAELTRLYIKEEDSIDEGAKYRQENRVVALTVADEIQERLFEPLAIKPNEVADYVQLKLEVANKDGRMPKCLNTGRILVRSIARHDSAIQELTAEEKEKLQEGAITVFLDSEPLKAFTSMPGDYEARASLTSACDATTLNSEWVRFHVKAKSVLLDEIFALSPFDTISFIYSYDNKRIQKITEELFQKIAARIREGDDGMPVEALVLVSGHTDVLSQHRGSFYNLGLSFERAHLAEQKLLKEIERLAAQKGFSLNGASSSDTAYYVSTPMRDKMLSPLYAKPRTQKFFAKLLSKPYTKPFKTGLAKDYYEIIKREKLRHFTTEPRRPFDPLLPYSVGAIMARVREIDDNVVCGLITIPMRHGRRQVRIDVFTAGFGATIPFYRRFRMAEDDELKTIFCAGGMAPNDITNAIFADDDHPSGRVMNRRVEVSLIVDKLSPETNGVSRK
jgi:outer membrane protein OmpA-like peptidoglycan-associated protein